MPSTPRFAPLHPRPAALAPLFRPACLLPLLLLTTGCTVTLSPLARHTDAFSLATAGIVDNSEDAYRSAMRLHHEEQVDKAIQAYGPGWSPYTALTPLLTPEQLDARIKILDGLKVYAESLVELTNPKRQYAPMSAASASAGTSLQSLSTAATPGLQKLFPAATAMSAGETTAVTAAINALGRLLINNEVHRSLAKTTQEMDPNIEVLCQLIGSDVKILRRQADVDYQTLITDQNQFLQAEKIDPALRRTEIARLIHLAARQQNNDAVLEKLQAAVTALTLTHHALAAAAAGNNPESVRQHVADLITAGKDLGNTYKVAATVPTT